MPASDKKKFEKLQNEESWIMFKCLKRQAAESLSGKQDDQNNNVLLYAPRFSFGEIAKSSFQWKLRRRKNRLLTARCSLVKYLKACSLPGDRRPQPALVLPIKGPFHRRFLGLVTLAKICEGKKKSLYLISNKDYDKKQLINNRLHKCKDR